MPNPPRRRKTDSIGSSDYPEVDSVSPDRYPQYPLSAHHQKHGDAQTLLRRLLLAEIAELELIQGIMMTAIENLRAQTARSQQLTESVKTLVSTLESQQTGVPEADVQAAADAQKAVNDELEALLPSNGPTTNAPVPAPQEL